MKQGLLIVLSGPAGVGKGTLTKKLERDHMIDAVFPISYTTRMRRLKETQDKQYHFIPEEEFAQKEKEGFFLESSEFCLHHYGTPKQEILDALNSSKNVFLEVETKGAKKIMDLFPGMYTIAIFLMPPTMEELERRIRLRHSESEEQIQDRLATAKEEILEKDNYDVVLTNYSIKKTATRLVQSIENRIKYIEAKENGEPLPVGYTIKRP